MNNTVGYSKESGNFSLKWRLCPRSHNGGLQIWCLYVMSFDQSKDGICVGGEIHIIIVIFHICVPYWDFSGLYNKNPCSLD